MLERELEAGHTVANHTWTHIDTSGRRARGARASSTAPRAIKEATNFTPCLFRPPFGAKSNASVALTARKWHADGPVGRRHRPTTSAPRASTSPARARRRRSRARSCSCTTAAARASRRSPRCPRSSRACAPKGYSFVTLDEAAQGPRPLRLGRPCQSFPRPSGPGSRSSRARWAAASPASTTATPTSAARTRRVRSPRR